MLKHNRTKIVVLRDMLSFNQISTDELQISTPFYIKNFPFKCLDISHSVPLSMNTNYSFHDVSIKSN